MEPARDPLLVHQGGPLLLRLQTIHPAPCPAPFCRAHASKNLHKGQQLRAEKDSFSRSKCSFQTRPPPVGMEQGRLGAPQLTLGGCQESSRYDSLPPSPPCLCTALLLWAYCLGPPWDRSRLSGFRHVANQGVYECYHINLAIILFF